MNSFIAAFNFLTVIPVKNGTVSVARLSRSSVYFPLVGLMLGSALAGLQILLSLVSCPPLLSSLVLVAMLALLTGGLHLDGLADTFDALGSRKTKDEMLDIMRDPHIGVMGVLSLIFIILLKVSLLSALEPAVTAPALILSCLISRYSLVFLMFSFPYARTEGKAMIFFEGMNRRIFAIATLLCLAGSLAIFRLPGLLVLAAAVFFVFAAGKAVSSRIGGLTGDSLGAITELTEVFVLGAMLAASRAGFLHH